MFCLSQEDSTLEKKSKTKTSAFDLITYWEEQVAIYTSNKVEENLLAVLDGEGAAVVVPGPIGFNETRLEDFDLVTGYKRGIVTLPNLPAFSPASE